MYELNEPSEEQRRARSLIRVSESKREEARFFSPREPILIDFQDRGIQPLSEGRIYRKSYARPHGAKHEPFVSLKLFGFDERHRGTGLATMNGFWGRELDFRDHAGGNIVYRGEIGLLPPGFVQDAIDLLDHRGGVDLEPAPWEDAS